MKSVLITGATDGVGKGLALHYLASNYKVYAVGTSLEKATQLKAEAKKLGKDGHLQFLQANLSLVSENIRVVNWVNEQVDQLDGAIFCAASLKAQPAYIETAEGLEFTFALYYMSRYVLSYELKALLEKSEKPFIVNVAAPGMKGNVHFEDVQQKENYNGQAVQFHGSRLNDLLAVRFTKTDEVRKIRYILFNPMAVRTPGAAKMFEGNSFGSKLGRLYYKLLGKDVEEIVSMIASHVEATNDCGMYAFKLMKEVPLTMATYNEDNAAKLDGISQTLRQSVKTR